MTAKESRTLRPATREDSKAILNLAVASGLFQEDETAVLAEMLADAFAGHLEDHHWIVLEDGPGKGEPGGGAMVAAACVAPEMMSDRTWNLYFIAVAAPHQGRGLGAALLTHVEETLRKGGARLLLIETSGLDSFAATRRFYRTRGYEEEARIRDFYRAGEDKIVFRKLL
ncbi:GNAT family N-acetyltransferase [Pelagibius sp.]|uniref:GNAT family N-acetyltransferase n=1 Tax=Pelagibius sp. TaxID=1931238 RepID=UPI003B5064BB